MYSWEIERLLKIKQNILSTSEYLEMMSSSPQISHVKYDNGCYNIETEDGYKFRVHVKSRVKS